MKKKVFNLIIVIITLLTLFASSTTNAVGSLISIGKPTGTPIVGIKVNEIIGVIKWCGYLIAIGMVIWSGVKYVLSGASEKAKAKETLIPICIGAFLVVAGVEITAAVFKMFE